MKKLVIIIATIAVLFSSAHAADWNFYGSARVSTFYENVEVSGSDTNNFDMGLQGNSRIGARIKVSDELSGRFEYGASDGNVNLRYLYGIWNFGAGSISWRFDPICFYKTKDGKIHDNLHDFNYISSKASKYGIKRCITSFMDDYHKIRKRIAKIPGFAFIDPPIEIKSEIVLKMKDELSDKNISLHTCCEKELLSILPENSGITKSSCIPNDLLMKLFGGSLSLNKDSGQRIKNGCGCKVSADVGSYSLHPCYHNCLFCYANPASSTNHA